MRRIKCNAKEATTIALFITVALTPLKTMSFVPRTSFATRPTVSLPPFSSRSIMSGRSRQTLRLQMNFDSDDPFQILGMDEPTTDQKIIKRAYKRMALKFHPDVLSTKDSTPEEKKQASDRFAKINWAYSTLSGKLKDDQTYNSKSSGRDSSSNTAGGGWTPPHRRSGQTYSSSSSKRDTSQGVDWEDFMPKQEEIYDTDGDSLGKIFSDLFTSAAVGAATGSSGSVFKDFIEFLEGNVDGYGSGGSDDADLRILLNTGSKEEIRNEMDDTELVVNQLKTKLDGINMDMATVTGEMNVSVKYLDKIKLEESLAELKARKDVVSGYLKKAQSRLLKLQTRYQEMMSRTSSYNDSYSSGRGGSQAAWDEIKRETTSYSQSSSSSSASAAGYRDKSKADDDSWKSEGFGSSGRGRGRGSRRRASTTSTGSSQRESAYSTPSDSQTDPFDSSGSRDTSADSDQDSWKREGFGSSRRGRGGASRNRRSEPSRTTSNQSMNTESTVSSNRSSSPSSPARKESFSANVPPHRRANSFSNQKEDKKRLREIQVDDEFEKLKRELGM